MVKLGLRAFTVGNLGGHGGQPFIGGTPNCTGTDQSEPFISCVKVDHLILPSMVVGLMSRVWMSVK